MHSASSRFNAVTITTGLTLAVMCLINFLHGYYSLQQTSNPQVKLQITQIPNFMKLSNWEQLSFRYNLEANLTSLYTWNLKQLYVYIQAEWVHEDLHSNSSNTVQDPNYSRAILADWILQTPDERSQQKIQKAYRISVQNKPLEYSVRDLHNSLRGNKLKIFLRCEHMPFVGIFFKSTLYQTTLQVPTDYISKK